jgi:hypothetical protein
MPEKIENIILDYECIFSHKRLFICAVFPTPRFFWSFDLLVPPFGHKTNSTISHRLLLSGVFGLMQK